MKITIIAGARPNFMKIAPIMRAIGVAVHAHVLIEQVCAPIVVDKTKSWSLHSSEGARHLSEHWQ